MITMSQEDFAILIQVFVGCMFGAALLAVGIVMFAQDLFYMVCREIRYHFPQLHLWQKRKLLEMRRKYRARVAAAGGVPR